MEISSELVLYIFNVHFLNCIDLLIYYKILEYLFRYNERIITVFFIYLGSIMYIPFKCTINELKI